MGEAAGEAGQGGGGEISAHQGRAGGGAHAGTTHKKES